MQSAKSARYVLQSCTGAGAGACALVVVASVVLEIRERKRTERNAKRGRDGVAVVGFDAADAMDRYAWIIDRERESNKLEEDK